LPAWDGLPFVEVDGLSWPLEFAAAQLGMKTQDWRDLVRITDLEPSGVIRMSDFRRQGRQPRAYPAAKLIIISEDIARLQEKLKGNLGSFRRDRLAPPVQGLV